MPERLSRPKAEKEADEIRELAKKAGVSHPTGEDYEDLDAVLTALRKEKKAIKRIAKKFAEMPELEQIRQSAESSEDILSKIRNLIYQKTMVEGKFPELKKIWVEREEIKMDPNEVDLELINEIMIILMQKKELAEKAITSYKPQLERFFDQEFSPEDIIDVICENEEGLSPKDFAVSGIFRDRNGKIAVMSLVLDEAKSLEKFGRFARYLFYYPQTGFHPGAGDLWPAYPLIVRTLNDSDAEFFFEMGVFDRSKIGEHSKHDSVAEFVDGSWHWEKEF